MAQLAITVIGHDRPGIIASVTAVLAERGGNLEDSSMTLLRGHFAMTLVVSTAASSDEVQGALVEALDDDLVVQVRAVPDEGELLPAGRPFVLTVHGADRVGIVAGVADLLAAAEVNITDLTTRLAGSLYVVVAELDVPSGADVDALSGRLASVARELGVEAALRPAETDVL